MAVPIEASGTNASTPLRGTGDYDEEDATSTLVVVAERIGMVGQRIVDFGPRKVQFQQPLDVAAVPLGMYRGREVRALHDTGQKKTHIVPLQNEVFENRPERSRRLHAPAAPRRQLSRLSQSTRI